MKRHSLNIIAMTAIAATALLLNGCGITTMTPEQKAEEDIRIEQGVKKALDSRQYKISVDTMIPRRGTTRHFTDPYGITVDGDKFISYLPYFGVAYDVAYGGGKVLNFEAKTDEYNRYTNRKGEEVIEIVSNNGEDVLHYEITIFSNGKASIDVRAKKRESISFWGELDPDRQPEFKN